MVTASPIVVLADALDGAHAEFVALHFAHCDRFAHARGQSGLILIRQPGVATDLGIFRCLEIQNQRTPAHSFDQGRMGASHFSRVDVSKTP